MRRSLTLLATFLLAASLALAPGVAFARAGFGGSMGSRGMRSFSMPRSTPTAPSAAPLDRTITPRVAPNSGFASPAPYRSGFGGGLLGGLVGVGLGSLLFGGGGFAGGLGFLIKLAIVFFVVRWLFRRFAGGAPAFAGMGRFARAPGAMPNMMSGGAAATGAARPSVTITRADYHAFEELLYAVQAAWSAQNLDQLRQLATPEMLSYFADQLAEQSSRGVRNTVTDVHLDKGDLSEAWSEPGREYATVAMHFSMSDVTYDLAGQRVAGDPNTRVQATELWTFLRTSGGRWILSAIQQGR